MKKLYYLLLIIIFILSIMPSEKLPEVAHFSDKLNHIVAYIILMSGYVYIWKEHFLRGAVLLFCYSVFVEVAQHFVPTRFFGFDDMIANLIGIVFGYFLGREVERRFNTKN